VEKPLTLIQSNFPQCFGSQKLATLIFISSISFRHLLLIGNTVGNSSRGLLIRTNHGNTKDNIKRLYKFLNRNSNKNN
jgi:hypothetical protein